MDILVPVPEEISLIPLQHIYQVENGITISIEIQMGLVPSYTLSTFLETYGPPTEIWLSTYSTEYPAGVLPFLAALFYPEHGILAIYGPQQTYLGDDIVHACQWDNPPSMFGFWAPEQNMTFLDAARHYRLNPDEPGVLFLPIEEATDLDSQSFYEVFKSPENSACLETPKDIWPGQQ
jgi:hypothetical protein